MPWYGLRISIAFYAVCNYDIAILLILYEKNGFVK